jgi:hypothetical protein
MLNTDKGAAKIRESDYRQQPCRKLSLKAGTNLYRRLEGMKAGK